MPHCALFSGSTLLACIAISIASMWPAAAADTLRIGAQGGLPTLDPHSLNETFTLGILSNVNEGLVRRDAKLNLQPALASRWYAVTPLRWRFHLRRNVRFHDGSPFTADDVIFSLNRARQHLSQQKDKIPKDVRMVKVDDFTIDFELKRPDPTFFLPWESLLIMSRSWSLQKGLEKAGIPGKPSSELLANGTGPYRLVSHDTYGRTRFSANTDWWGRTTQPIAYDTIELATIQGQTRTAALLAGQVDLIVPVPVQDLPRIGERAGLKTIIGPELRTIFLNMDQMRKTLIGGEPGMPNPLLDRRVREAIHYAIDADVIVRKVMRGQAVVASTLVSPLLLGDVSQIKRRGFDPDRSRALLRDAGYKNGFELALDCPGDRYVNDRQICEAIVGMLARVSIIVRLDVQPKARFFSKVLAGGGYNSAFSLLGWTPGSLDGLNVIANLARCRDEKGNGALFNLGGYCNPAVDRLTETARAEPEPARRNWLVMRSLQKIHDDAGFIPLHQQMIAWGMKKDIHADVRADNQIKFQLLRRSSTSLTMR